ncbi:hypothetical protein BUALT_Bualt04G0041000 [Buddleja alternifolia]|uniref:Transposase MuDR plant domain-containing protein n=1 Tax=Buddleja alternifolia TaxID=168488 RepID=A0AAV6XN66_9LAMI|nr:hypothetical protein BUALT_Bualt04G0041000 [Buddleja alternifolia]
MKGKSMVVGMKFENFRVYREALRDYCVRNRFDVEYIRNEAKRVTVTCKNENCKWRLHASPIQNTRIFQIKSLKGVPSYAKTFDNKLAKFSYIAKRLEQMTRDNPHVICDVYTTSSSSSTSSSAPENKSPDGKVTGIPLGGDAYLSSRLCFRFLKLLLLLDVDMVGRGREQIEAVKRDGENEG